MTRLFRCIAIISLCLGTGLVITSCGFRPLYSVSDTDPSDQNKASSSPQSLGDQFRLIAINRIPDEAGVILHNYLIDRLYVDGPPVDTKYRLDINLTQSRREIGILSDDTATRAQLILTANVTLIPAPAATDQQKHGGSWQRRYSTIASYNILENQFATQVAQEDALDRGLRRIGDQVIQGLALYFNR